MAISNPITIGTAAPAGASGTAVLTTTATVPSGGKVWIVVTWFGTETLSSVGDGGATVYTIDHQGFNGSNQVAIVQADYPSGLASGATITATFSDASTVDRQISGMYSTGVQANAAAAYGAIGASANTATVWNSGNITVVSGDILIGASKWEDSVATTSTPSGGNTEVHDWNAGGGYASTSVYQIGTGAAIAGSGTWSNTSGATSGIRAAAVAYTAAAGGGVGATLTGVGNIASPKRIVPLPMLRDRIVIPKPKIFVPRRRILMPA